MKDLVFELAFEANRVEAHFLDVTEFGFAAGLIDAEHHVRGPAATADEDRFAVHFEEAIAVGGQLGIGLHDAERDGLFVGGRTFVGDKFERELVEIRLAHLIGPP